MALRSFRVEFLHAVKGHGVDDISIIVENFIDRPVTVRPQAEQYNHVRIAAALGMRDWKAHALAVRSLQEYHEGVGVDALEPIGAEAPR